LTSKLLHAQDEEQRRIARDLHDSINQYHTAIKMNLARLNRSESAKSNHSHLLTQSLELLEECISETRTLSYLLHPPLLDEMGFFAAVSWYVKGFGQRSGIQVNLTLPSELERLPAVIEVALFRVVQEALTNIHRHATPRW
jgi:signal transduction histidine kinase